MDEWFIISCNRFLDSVGYSSFIVTGCIELPVNFWKNCLNFRKHLVCFIILNNTGTWSWCFWNIIIWIMLWLPCYKIIVKTIIDLVLWCCPSLVAVLNMPNDHNVWLWNSMNIDCSATWSFQPKVQKSYFTWNRQLEHFDITREPKSSINLYWSRVASSCFLVHKLSVGRKICEIFFVYAYRYINEICILSASSLCMLFRFK